MPQISTLKHFTTLNAPVSLLMTGGLINVLVHTNTHKNGLDQSTVKVKTLAITQIIWIKAIHDASLFLKTGGLINS